MTDRRRVTVVLDVDFHALNSQYLTGRDYRHLLDTWEDAGIPPGQPVTLTLPDGATHGTLVALIITTPCPDPGTVRVPRQRPGS